MEQEQSLPNKAQPKKKQQQVTPAVETKVEPQADTQVAAKEETKKVIEVGNMTITYN